MQLIEHNCIPYDEYKIMRDSLQKESFVNETWKDVKGLRDYYQVSSLSRFRAKQDIIYTNGSRWAKKGDIKHHASDIIEQHYSEYMTVTLYDPRVPAYKNKFANQYSHIIVSLAFKGKLNDGLITDHIDGNKHNNQINNLQRITDRENAQKTYDKNESNRWTNRKSDVVRSDGTYYCSIKEATEQTGQSDAAIIAAITTGGSCGGYQWKYADMTKQLAIESKRPKKRNKHVTNTGYKIRCKEYDEIKTGAEWARIFHCVSDTIYRAIDYSDGYSKYLDKHFELVDPRA